MRLAPQVELTCEYCGTKFMRRKAQWRRDVQVRNLTAFWCSRECRGRSERRKHPSHLCERCGEQFSRKPHGKHDALKYCSRPCASKAIGQQLQEHNRAVGKKRAPRVCGLCPNELGSSNTSGLCIACYLERASERREQTTLKELRRTHTTAEFHAKVRAWARKEYDGPMACEACGYETHVDICHVQPVAAFPSDTRIADVNRRSNLVALCRNHHWEFDNGLLVLDGPLRAAPRSAVVEFGPTPGS